ncbi:SusC/RagA family TonB-linked outer membrane protein [Aquimarina sp. BL5]|uniref:SusC/RagA family TonB-linked outer membrane protein n=1 Tax=Aquimarina sp. BL5 TaxID=1714860 RepID=UPI000E501C8D|nr:SusC/RagA family TonB-linked outer membrane protein [Aquimarina sp. BL5]AXT49522.1 SusC/RagA family TonB-linked outer membrane protein [Aquimarina sp. BL5]RKM96242.1 SusC/RagA family TonB-linked outer membrane protein [Aquimarina sp. BL5]
MKKNLSGSFLSGKDLIRIMKIYSLLLCIAISKMFSFSSYSQNISISVNEVKLKMALDEIEFKSEFNFFYNNSLIDVSKKVSVTVANEKIRTVLKKLFRGTDIDFKIYKKSIVLFPKNSKASILEIRKLLDNLEETYEKEKTRKSNRIRSPIIQQSSIIGTVISEDNQPLPGVNIIVKGTNKGALTDFDGKYQVAANTGDVLVFSYVGFQTQEIRVDSSKTIDVTMIEDVNSLEEIVVTAQGIKKSRKALGFAIAQIDTEETDSRPEVDISRTLQGKISGVQITPSSGSSGASTEITIRGSLSLTQGNNALIVIDNVPFSGNLLDIDPNSIKGITVLKGLNAAVLYGSQGRNGVVIIETKSGSASIGEKSFKATVVQTTYTNMVANLPDFQNTYGVGNNLVTDAGTIGNVGSNGARFTDIDFVPHPLSGNPSFPEFANQEVPYVAARNNVNDFFRTGIGQITSLNLDATGENTSLNFSMGYTSEEGILGNNEFKRFNISIGGTSQLTDRLRLSTSISYSTRVRDSYTSEDSDDAAQQDILESLYVIPRSLDIQNLPFQDPITGANVYYRSDRLNPLWTLNNTGRERVVQRINTTINLSYKLNKNHNLKYRGGFQFESADTNDFRNRGGLGAVATLGELEYTANTEFDVDNTLIFESNYKLSDNIGFDSQIGINSRYETFRSLDSDYTDQIVFGVLRPNNFRTPGQGDYDEIKENLLGVFGQFQFDYNSYLYLGLSGRLDQGSTVEKDNQNLFYPGVSISFIPTSAFNMKSGFVNYLKLRGAYATSAGFPEPFNTRNSLSSDPREFSDFDNDLIVTNSFFGTLANPDLKPELHKEFEIGVEGNFFRNTVSLQASVFSRVSENQIFETNIAPGTGFDSTFINAGRLDTEGLEIDLGVQFFKNSNFKWNIRNIFTTFKTTVVELANGANRLEGEDGNLDLIIGEELGSFLGSYVVRDSDGNALINPATGIIIASDDVGLQDEVIGNVTPDFRATSIHTFSYKNFVLSTQFEYTHGGERREAFLETLLERGVTTDTRNREGSFVIPGVLGDISSGSGEPLLDVNGNTIPNTIQVTGNNAVFNNFYDPNENAVFDASVFRIREVALSYKLDKKAIQNLPFDSMDFRLSGRNLFFYAPGFPSGLNFDPETRGFTTPTTKRYSFSVGINF